MKKVLGVYSAPEQHWVGDGFPVRTLFSYADPATEDGPGKKLSPFLLLDYAGPMQFEPSTRPRGVGAHPHRGFETVTIVYHGEVAHRDSTGAGGTIGPGDVQWMTAAAGILHEEFHSPAFTRSGGLLEMVQLWVNLPEKDKMSAPSHQTLLNRQIPAVELTEAAGTLRVIAGKYEGHPGPAHTFTPMDVWDLHLNQGHAIELEFPDGRNTAILVLHGSLQVNGSGLVGEAEIALLDSDERDCTLLAGADSTVLVLSGDPIHEPVVGQGPFVMNTQQEIDRAISDYRSGKFGQLLSGHAR